MRVEPFEAGYLHYPEEPSGDALALTHGAGSDASAPLLVAVAQAFAACRTLVYRYDLPFRRVRGQGPPRPATAGKDRDGIRDAVRLLRAKGNGRLLAGGHSYGGRQTSMVAAEDGSVVDGLLLLSYPLHPPKKPEQLRTRHFPDVAVRALFVHGAKDPFGTPEEMREALKQIPAPHELYIVEGAGHDLGKHHARLAQTIVEQAGRFLPTS